MAPSTGEVAELVRQRLRAMDMEGFADLLAEDVVFEYPFGFPGAPGVLRGREAVRSHLRESRGDLGTVLRIDEVTARTHVAADPEVVVREFEATGTGLATGEGFRFWSGVSVITVRGGEIVRYRDYTNVLGAARVAGGGGASVSASTGESGG
jgi:ketosteroid isomerase-like protein